jgi:hypothetical protein
MKQKTEPTYAERLEESLHDLISIIVDPGLLNFLTDKERQKFSKVLQNLPAKQ